MTQLTPLHTLLDQGIQRLLPEAKMRAWSESLTVRYPKLALAIYRGLLSHYALEQAQQSWKDLRQGRD